jgi:hypothetical protein
VLRRLSWKTARDLVPTLAFVVLVALPGGLAAARGFPPEPLFENRSPAPYPKPGETPAAEFPADFERWFSDHFAFRGELVRLSSRIRYALAVSSAPLVVVAKDGWLLFKGDFAIEGFRRTKVFDDATLDNWRSALSKRRNWLAARGIHYLVVVHPNKETIYPELVPPALNRLPRASATEQLLDVLEDAGIQVVDTSSAIRGMKRTGTEVFLHTDTHWNGLGCFAAYGAVAARLEQWFPSCHPMGLDAFRVSHREARGGDLSGMLAIPDVVRERDRADIEVASPRTRRSGFDMALPANIGPHEMPWVMEQPDPSLPRAVVLGDSFMQGASRLLGEHFSRLVYYGRHEIAPDIIQRERPDVVIDAWLERMLFAGPPSNANFDDGMPKENVAPAPLGMDEPHEPGLPFSSPMSWALNDLSRLEEGTVTVTGPAPWAQAHFSPFASTQTQAIWVELTAFPLEAGSIQRRQGRLFWCAEGQHFDEDHVVVFPILADGMTHRYRIRPAVSPGWTGEIADLRLDLPNAEGLTYRLGAVELVP